MVAAVPPPLHVYVLAPVAVSVTCGAAQVMVAGVAMLTGGGVVLDVTVLAAVAVQPFVPVTVTL